MKRIGLLVAVISLLACTGGGLARLPGYSKPFRLNGGFAVGTPGAEGVRWEQQPLGEHYEGVVVATWCPTCEALLAARNSDPTLRSATANLFFLDTEAARDVERAADGGQLNPAEREAALGYVTASGQMVTYPERLEGLGARAVHFDEVPAEWFPFFFTCDGNACEGWAADGF